MGHSTHTETITAEHAQQIRQGLGKARHQGYWGSHPTFESEMVTEAVRRWREDEADRHDGERSGSGYLTKSLIAPPPVAT